MLAIGRALMARPALVMLDEPSMGLAPLVVKDILGHRSERIAAGGTTVLLVEQNARSALRVADRGYVLETGRVVLEGTAEELLAEPRRAARLPGQGRRPESEREPHDHGAAGFWQPDDEAMDREELEQLQLERLQATLNRVHRNVPFYRRRFDEAGASTPTGCARSTTCAGSPSPPRTTCATTTPTACSPCRCATWCGSTPPRARPGCATVVGYTRNDLKTWSNLVARVLVAGGVTKDDVVQMAFDYGLFTGAFGLHHGAERLGASVIPISSGNTRARSGSCRTTRPPPWSARPATRCTSPTPPASAGLQPERPLAAASASSAAEPWSRGDAPADRRTSSSSRPPTTTASPSCSGPGVAGECLERQRPPRREDHFLVEVVDPETLAPGAADGPVGELVVTTLTKEAFPLIRFRTRDLASLTRAPCACGRTLARMSRVKGRTDDLLIVKGVKRLPLGDRGGAPRGGGDRAPLRDRARAAGGAGRGHRAGRGLASRSSSTR